MSPNTALMTRNTNAIRNTIPMRVRRVIRKDFIHPRALQRVTKKKIPTITPTIRAVSGAKNNDAIHIETRLTALAMSVLIILFQRETDSSLR